MGKSNVTPCRSREQRELDDIRTRFRRDRAPWNTQEDIEVMMDLRHLQPSMGGRDDLFQGQRRFVRMVAATAAEHPKRTGIWRLCRCLHPVNDVQWQRLYLRAVAHRNGQDYTPPLRPDDKAVWKCWRAYYDDGPST